MVNIFNIFDIFDSFALGRVPGLGGAGLLFQLGESPSVALQSGTGSATYSRTSSATVIDHEGLVRTVPANCALRSGARIVENMATGAKEFITPNSATSSAGSYLNTPSVLISDASDTSYSAPDPSFGGGGTSWYADSDATTLTFVLDSLYDLTGIHIWDYYSFSATDWALSFFDADSNLISTTNFSITTSAANTSTLSTITFSEVGGVSYVELTNTNNSVGGGIGLSEVHFKGTRLASETITVVSGNEYQVTIAGNSAATAVCSNAFTGTLTADGTNRISWNSGTPKTAASTSLVITVTGTLTELMVEDVTGQANQNPSEYVSVGVESAPYHGLNVDSIKAFDNANGNTVDGSGVVTEATGAAISPAPSWQHMPAATNSFPYSRDLTNAAWVKANATCTYDQVGITGAPNSASVFGDDSSTGTGAVTIDERDVVVVSGQNNCVIVDAKEKQLSWIRVSTMAYDATDVTYFDLNNGVVGATDTHDDSDIIELGNGWYRCIVQFATTTDVYGTVRLNLADGNGDVTVDLDGTSDVYIGNVELHLNSTIAEVRDSSPIFTSGAAASRTAPVWKYPRAGNVDETIGTLVVKGLIPGAAYADIPNSTFLSYVSLKDIAYNLLYAYRTSVPSGVFPKSYDDTISAEKIYEWLAGNEYNLAVRWNATTLKFQVGYQDVTGAGSWQWGTEVAFDGAFAISDFIQLFYDNAYPQKYRDILIWGDDQGTDFIEARY